MSVSTLGKQDSLTAAAHLLSSSLSLTPWHLVFCLPAYDTGQVRQKRPRWPPQSTHHSHLQYTHSHTWRQTREERHRWPLQGVHHFTYTHLVQIHRNRLCLCSRGSWMTTSEQPITLPNCIQTQVWRSQAEGIFPLTVKGTLRCLLTYVVPAGKT